MKYLTLALIFFTFQANSVDEDSYDTQWPRSFGSDSEIKLEKSVKIIFGMFALGIILNAVTPDFPVKEALAQSLSHGGSISVHCYGCN